jgi:RND family efflux transporter MFP subunit
MVEAKKMLLLALAGAALLNFSGCGDTAASSRKEEGKAAAPARKVKTAKVERGTIEEIVMATGSLAAQDRAVLSVKAPGRLEEILVDIGSKVDQGAVLARIEKNDYALKKQQAEAALKEAKAVLQEAERNLARITKLQAQGIVPEAETETLQSAHQVAVTRVDQRQAEVNQAEQSLLDTEIKAPFAGVVEMRQANLGEYLNTAAPILTLVRIDPIRLKLEVAETDSASIRPGQTVRLHAETTNAPVALGQLVRLSPVISAVNRMLQVEADLENKEGLLRPGSYVEADIVVDPKKQALTIPSSALFTFAGLEKVVVVEQGKAKEVAVRTGRRSQGKIEILSGLKEGQIVVLEPGNIKTGEELAIGG